MNTPSLLLRSHFSFDPLNTERQEYCSEEEQILPKLSKIEFLKQRMASLCESESFQQSETKASTIGLSSTPKSGMGADCSSVLLDQLELKRDKYLNLSRFYCYLDEQARENVRICMNELRHTRNEMVAAIDHQMEVEAQEVLLKEKEVLAHLSSLNEKCTHKIEEISVLIQRATTQTHSHDFLSSAQLVLRERDPEAQVHVDSIQFPARFAKRNAAVQTGDENECLKLKVYLPCEYKKFCPVIVTHKTCARDLLRQLLKYLAYNEENYCLAVKQSSLASPVKVRPLQLLAQIGLASQSWPRLYLVKS